MKEDFQLQIIHGMKYEKQLNKAIDHKVIFLLGMIMILGFILRIYNISNIPSGLFADEASIGYNAYTLITQGKDEAGNTLPVLFESFGGTFYRPGISIYASSFFIALLGLNEFALRLTPVVIGTLTIFLVFWLSYILFSSTRIALLSAFFLSIAPWHIHFSRINQEFIYLVFIFCLSILTLLIGLNKKPKLIPLAFIFFGLSLYSYVTAYFIIPLFIISLLIIYLRESKKNFKYISLGIILFLFLASPLISGVSNGKTLSRFKQVSSANEKKTKQEIIFGITNTYVGHFSPEFLLTKGDIDYKGHFITRFSVRGMGQLYLFQIPFILLGLIFSFRFKKTFYTLLFWILIYPLGSTAAPFADGGGPFAMRSIIGVIPFQILTAAGIIFFLSLIKNNNIKAFSNILIILVLCLSLIYYLNLYFVKYPKYSSNFWGWQYGPREIISYYIKNQNNYDELIMSYDFNAPEIFPKFYGKGKCTKCLIGLPNEKYNPNKRQLFSVTQQYLEKNKLNFVTLKNIYYPSGEVAFKIGIIVQ
jgi:4-amino-4-deoxy-L-arabinose transferase-like glycosyltransferase